MELIIVVFSAVVILFSCLRSTAVKRVDIAAVVVLLVMAVLHFLFRGPRWQMTAAYVFIIYHLVRSILNLRGKESFIPVSRRQLVMWLVLLAVTVFLIWIMPYNSMPNPAGEMEIGTISFDAVDNNRTELYSSSPGGPRKIRLQVWYPASVSDDSEKNKWLADGVDVAGMVPKFAGMPAFTMKYAARIDSNSYEDVPLLHPRTPHPVVVISHGWLGFRNVHSDYAELLASNGYIVVGIDHTFGSMAVVFDDGRLAPVDPEALPSSEDPGFAEYANRLVLTYSLDTEFVLDLLSKLNTGGNDGTSLVEADLFEGSLDLEKIGLIGHSTGGGGIVRLAINDPRVKAVFGLDPWVEPVPSSILGQGLVIPSVFLRSGQWAFHENNKHLEILNQNSRAETLMYQLNGSSHLDFSMMYMFEPVTKLFGYAGTLDSRRSGEIQRDLILKFFNTTLKSNGDGFSGFAELYPELVDIYFQQ